MTLHAGKGFLGSSAILVVVGTTLYVWDSQLHFVKLEIFFACVENSHQKVMICEFALHVDALLRGTLIMLCTLTLQCGLFSMEAI